MGSRAVIAPQQEVSDDPGPRGDRAATGYPLPSFASAFPIWRPGGHGASCSRRAVWEQGGSRLIIQRGC